MTNSVSREDSISALEHLRDYFAAGQAADTYRRHIASLQAYRPPENGLRMFVLTAVLIFNLSTAFFLRANNDDWISVAVFAGLAVISLLLSRGLDKQIKAQIIVMAVTLAVFALSRYPHDMKFFRAACVEATIIALVLALAKYLISDRKRAQKQKIAAEQRRQHEIAMAQQYLAPQLQRLKQLSSCAEAASFFKPEFRTPEAMNRLLSTIHSGRAHDISSAIAVCEHDIKVENERRRANRRAETERIRAEGYRKLAMLNAFEASYNAGVIDEMRRRGY